LNRLTILFGRISHPTHFFITYWHREIELCRMSNRSNGMHRLDAVANTASVPVRVPWEWERNLRG